MTASVYEGAAPQEGLVPQATQEAQRARTDAPETPSPAMAAAAVPPAQPAQHTPEVEQALAVLRSRQTEGRNQADATRKGRTPSRRGDQLTGLQLAQQAQREAGDKLGSGIRPAALSRRNHKPSLPSAGQLAAANANAAQTPGASALPPLTAASVEQGDMAQPSPQTAVEAARTAPEQQRQPPEQEQQASVRRVRYTTNLPKQRRQTDKEDLIRMLNMDSPQPVAASATADAARPQGDPAMPNSRAQAARDSAALKQMMEARESGQAATPVATTGPLEPLTGA